MSREILNEEDYRIILQKYSKNDEIKFISSKYIQLSDNVEGFMGDYFILEITFLHKNQEQSEQFFVKTLPTHNDIQGVLAAKRNVYEKEIFFYDFLMKEYEKFNFNTSFAPNCYYCKDNKILIMENLVGKQFKLLEKNKLYNLDQMKAGLKALALYHSASILYEEEMTKKFGRIFRLNEEYPVMFKENYLDVENDEVFSKLIFNKTVECIMYVIDNNKNKEYNEEFKKYLNSQTILKGLFAKTNFRQATGHGDLWYNNIFFKDFNSKSVDCKLVDFQILRYTHPALDILLFIHLNSDKEFRETYLHSLLNYYYDIISNNFSQHGYDVSKVFPITDFKDSVNFVETTAMFNVLSIGTLTFFPADILQEMYDRMSENWEEIHMTIFKKAFNTREDYRKVVTHAVDDIYNSLFRNSNKKYF